MTILERFLEDAAKQENLQSVVSYYRSSATREELVNDIILMMYEVHNIKKTYEQMTEQYRHKLRTEFHLKVQKQHDIVFENVKENIKKYRKLLEEVNDILKKAEWNFNVDLDILEKQLEN